MLATSRMDTHDPNQQENWGAGTLKGKGKLYILKFCICSTM